MPKTRLVETPDKPLKDYTPDELRAFRAPSVEDHLVGIRKALALTLIVMRGVEEEAALGMDQALLADAGWAARDRLQDAWTSAVALHDAIDGRTQNLHVISEGVK